MGLDNNETCLMTARHCLHIVTMLCRIHSLDDEDGEALGTIAAIGIEHIEAVEQRLFPSQPQAVKN
ncbi:MAG: hypothetical protein ACK4Q5_19890 [Saprospiraceae bacterium]